MKITIRCMGTSFLNISRNVHFQVMVFLWILISIKLSIDWGIKQHFWETWIFGDQKTAPFWIWLKSRDWSKFTGCLRLKKVLNKIQTQLPVIKNLTGKLFSYFPGGTCLRPISLEFWNSYSSARYYFLRNMFIGLYVYHIFITSEDWLNTLETKIHQ